MASLLPDSSIKGIIEELLTCCESKGLNISFDIDKDFNTPGIINLLRAVIEVLEEGIKEALGVIGKLIEIAKLALETLTDPSLVQKVLDKVDQYKKDLQKILDDVIGYIIGKILEPVIKNFAVPLILPAFPGINIELPGLPNLPNLEKLKELLKIPEFIEKLANTLLIPVKAMIAFFKSIIDKITEILSNPIGKLIKFIKDFVKDPIKFFLDLIIDAFTSVISSILAVFATIDLGNIDDILSELISDIFSSKFKGLEYYIGKVPALGNITAPLILLTCILQSVLTLLPNLFKMIIKL